MKSPADIGLCTKYNVQLLLETGSRTPHLASNITFVFHLFFALITWRFMLFCTITDSRTENTTGNKCISYLFSKYIFHLQ